MTTTETDDVQLLDGSTFPTDRTPAAMFARLVREVDAGRALVEQSGPRGRQLAALDALDLARAVLTDALDLFGSCACGAVELHADDDAAPCCIATVTSGGRDHEPDCVELVHAAGACVRIDRAGAQL